MDALHRLRAIADYQFGGGSGKVLFPEGTEVTHSRSTGRPRHVFLKGRRTAMLRPNDGFLALTPEGARMLVSGNPHFDFKVIVMEGVSGEIAKGKNVFAKHVEKAGPKIRPGDEVVVLHPSGQVLAVGKAILNADEMLAFKTGVAVRVRKGGLNGMTTSLLEEE